MTIIEVDSAIPSIAPTVNALVPNVVTKKQTVKFILARRIDT